jgi:probable metal-binding protein
MTDPIAIHGHEIIELVSSYPTGIRVSQLAATVADRFGEPATFHTCSATGMNLDALLVFLETRGKVRILGEVVFPGTSPACNP